MQAVRDYLAPLAPGPNRLIYAVCPGSSSSAQVPSVLACLLQSRASRVYQRWYCSTVDAVAEGSQRWIRWYHGPIIQRSSGTNFKIGLLSRVRVT